MKNIYALSSCLIAWAFSAGSLMAQQVPQFAAFTYTPKYYNPAAQGGASGGGVGVLYRMQFTELPSGSRPVSYMAHADISPLINDRIGLGLQFIQDEAHLVKRTGVTGFFGYHLLPASQPFRVSLGAMAGYLTQNLDLSTATVNDPYDLVLMRGRESAGRFDGGMGLQAQWVQDNGGGVFLDVALPQLFTSDLSYKPGGDAGEREVRFDVLPHVLSSLAYRWQSEAFAIEPNVVYRESFGKKIKAANLEFNLRAYFLPDNLLMIGGGYRMDDGGILANVAVRPIPSIRINAGYENHSALGSTFEAGAQYLFGGGGFGCKSGPAENNLTLQINAAKTARQSAYSLAVTARDKIAFAKAALNEAQSAPNYQVQQTRLANADKHIADTENLLAKIRAEAQKAAIACDSANAIKQQAAAQRRKLCNAKNADGMPADCDDARNQVSDIEAQLRVVKDRRSTFKPALNLNDPAAIQNYLNEEVKKLSAKPEDLKIRRVTASEIEVQYADPEKAYVVTSSRSFADFWATQLQSLKNQGLVVESIRLTGDLQSRNPSNAKVNANYNGEYGDRLQTTYKMNNGAKTSDIRKNTALDMEKLAVLKLYDIRQYLAPKIGLQTDKITIELSSGNSSIEYDQVTRMIVNYRK